MNPELAPFVETPEDEYLPSLRELYRILRQRIWVIALVVITCLGVAAGFSFVQAPTYESSVKILVGQEQGDNAPSNLGSEVQGLQQIAQTMTEAVDTRPIAEAAIQRLDLPISPEAFLENLQAKQIGATQFIEVSYEDTDPERAQRTANSVGDVFSEQVSEVSPSANAITATVWERAVVPDEPVSPDLVRNGLLALALGLMLGVGLAFLLEYLDDGWRSPEEVERVSGVPTFGVIQRFEVFEDEAPKDKKKGEAYDGSF